MPIERDVLDRLTEEGLLHEREVTEVLTGRSFAVAVLADGSVGTAMDYSHFRHQSDTVRSVSVHRGAAAQSLLRRPAGSPWQQGSLLTHSPNGLSLTEQAVKIAVMSALSGPAFTPDNLRRAGYGWTTAAFEEFHGSAFGPAHKALTRAVGGADTVGVVGFGGLMEPIARLESVRRVLVSDLNHEPRMAYIERALTRFNSRFVRPKIEFVGPDLGRLRDECAVVQITPSSLCNGTIDDVIAKLSGLPVIVVGPSGAVVPRVWFEHGAVLVCTERKDHGLVEAYQYDDHLYEWFVEYDRRLLLWRDQTDPSGVEHE